MKFIYILIAAFYSSTLVANTEITCIDYLGTTISPRSFQEAITALKPLQPKGEYETTSIYEARIALANSGVALVISKPIEDLEFLSYDADAGELKIDSHLFNNSVFDDIPLQTKLLLDGAPYTEGLFSSKNVVMSQSDKVVGSYDAKNVFGVSVTVSKVDRKIHVIIQPGSASFDKFIFKNTKGSENSAEIGSIKLTPEEAKAFKPTARIAFVVVPQAPILIKKKYGLGGVTIRYPKAVTVDATILFADFRCGLLMNERNKVMASFETY